MKKNFFYHRRLLPGLTRGEGSVYFYAIPNEEFEFKLINETIDNEIDEILKKGILKIDLK